MNCGVRVNAMATKMKMMKLLQEIRGFAEFPRRPQLPKPNALYLMQLRSHVARTTPARRRLIIAIDTSEQHGFPETVRIQHLRANV
jgi:hypothetical protein